MMEIPKEIIDVYLSYPERADFVPVSVEDNRMLFWISDEKARAKADFFAFSLGYRAKIEFKGKKDVLEAFERLYQQLETPEPEDEFQEVEDYIDEENLLGSSYTDAPIVELVNRTIVKALQSKASDIHFEGWVTGLW